MNTHRLFLLTLADSLDDCERHGDGPDCHIRMPETVAKRIATDARNLASPPRPPVLQMPSPRPGMVRIREAA